MKAKLAQIFTIPLIVCFLFSNTQAATDVVVFSVVRNLQLKPSDPIYKDYYINGGSENGYRVGSVVTVVRRLPAHDIYRNKALGDVTLPVAKLKLIYVQKQMSIGRIISSYSPKDIPNLGFETVMVGDRVVLGEGHNFGELDMGQDEEGKNGNKSGEAQGITNNDQSEKVVSSEVQESTEPAGLVASPMNSQKENEVKPSSAKLELPEKEETKLNQVSPPTELPRKREPSSKKIKSAPAPDSVQIGPNA